MKILEPGRIRYYRQLNMAQKEEDMDRDGLLEEWRRVVTSTLIKICSDISDMNSDDIEEFLENGKKYRRFVEVNKQTIDLQINLNTSWRVNMLGFL